MLSPTFWAFVRRSSSTIDGVMAISKFDLFFFTSWPSYLTFDQQHLQADVTYKATYMGQI